MMSKQQEENAFKIMTGGKSTFDYDRKLFCGEFDGVQRYDDYKYVMSKKLVDVMISATWFVKELSFAADKAMIRSMDSGYLELYFSNLAFQTRADSLANRFLDNVLSSETTSPELEAVLKYQSFQELNHSLSYAHNITEVSANATAILDDYINRPEIRDRLNIELAEYGKVIPLDKQSYEYKQYIFDVLITQYVLESLRFMVSFLYTFKLDSLMNNSLKGSVSNIKLILNDELIHCSIFAWLIKLLRTSNHEGFSELYTDEELDTIILDKFSKVIESELEWFDYLSGLKQIPGFTKDGIESFLTNIAHEAVTRIGVSGEAASEVGFVKSNNDITVFFERNKLINNTKTLAQESNNKSYNIATLNQSKIEGEFLDAINMKEKIFELFQAHKVSKEEEV